MFVILDSPSRSVALCEGWIGNPERNPIAQYCIQLIYLLLTIESMGIKITQQEIKTFCEENNIACPPEQRALDLMSELGEVAKEILKMTDYGKSSLVINEEIKSELGDALFALMELANTLNVDLEEALEKVMEKYQARLAKGSAGSESDKVE